MKAIGELRCEGLILRDFSERDMTESYVSWLNDPEVVKFSRQRFFSHSLESCRAFWRSVQEKSEYFVAVYLEDNGLSHIGNLMTSSDLHNGVVDLSILMGNRNVWGQGHGGKAWKMLMDHILLSEDVRMVTAGCMSANVAMMHVIQKSKMLHYYTRPDYFVLDGKYFDSVHYRKLKN